MTPCSMRFLTDPSCLVILSLHPSPCLCASALLLCGRGIHPEYEHVRVFFTSTGELGPVHSPAESIQENPTPIQLKRYAQCQ